MNKDDLAVDQAMVVWQGTTQRRRYDGRVAKIARKYVTVEIWRSSGHTDEIEFDVETQKERGNSSHYAAIFRTAAQQELADRKHKAEDGMARIGLTKRRADVLSLDEMEAVVALIDGMRAEHADREAAFARQAAGPPPWIPA